jgi:hypothetical protein
MTVVLLFFEAGVCRFLVFQLFVLNLFIIFNFIV